MDLKTKAEEIIAKLKKDPKLLDKFTKNPVPVVEELVGMDLPDDQINQVVNLIKTRIDLDKVSGLLGGLGSMLKK